MRRTADYSVLVVDAVGGALVTLCAAGFLWLTVVREGGPAAAASELHVVLDSLHRDGRGLAAARDRQKLTVADRREELSHRDFLPAESSIESYFETLAALADRHRLQVRRQNPIGHRVYPGLLEQRFAYEVSGRFPDLAKFLKDIETTESWADVSYLRIEPDAASSSEKFPERAALLTLSLFSAIPTTQPGASPVAAPAGTNAAGSPASGTESP